MVKEFYSFAETRKLLDVGEKAFKTMREKGQIKTIGKKVARVELERIGCQLGDTASKAEATAKTADEIELEKRRAELNKALVEKGFNNLADFERRFEALVKREQEVAQLYIKAMHDKADVDKQVNEAEIKLKKTNYEIGQQEKIQAQFDKDMETQRILVHKELEGKRKEASEQVAYMIAEAESARAKAQKIEDMYKEKFKMILSVVEYYDSLKSWIEKYSHVKDNIEISLGAILNALSNQHFKVLDVDGYANSTLKIMVEMFRKDMQYLSISYISDEKMENICYRLKEEFKNRTDDEAKQTTTNINGLLEMIKTKNNKVSVRR